MRAHFYHTTWPAGWTSCIRACGPGGVRPYGAQAAFEGSAPLLFGFLSRWLGGETRLMGTFLIMLIPALVASSLAIPGRRTYARDVATAAASVKATSVGQGQPQPLH